MPEERTAIRLTVTGRVQGVGYRASLHREATRLGLAGWVRNRRDGSVEAEVHGEPAAVERLVGWARRGPPSAVVQEVAVSALATGSGADSPAAREFAILPTV